MRRTRGPKIRTRSDHARENFDGPVEDVEPIFERPVRKGREHAIQDFEQAKKASQRETPVIIRPQDL